MTFPQVLLLVTSKRLASALPHEEDVGCNGVFSKLMLSVGCSATSLKPFLNSR